MHIKLMNNLDIQALLKYNVCDSDRYMYILAVARDVLHVLIQTLVSVSSHLSPGTWASAASEGFNVALQNNVCNFVLI